jgi:hypothetical protein
MSANGIAAGERVLADAGAVAAATLKQSGHARARGVVSVFIRSSPFAAVELIDRHVPVDWRCGTTPRSA